MQHSEDMNVSSLSLQSPAPFHDIFVSHSGAQKGFGRDLYHKLKGRRFRPFFDENYESLPLGDSFPEHIRAAASSCKLALVILSDDYLSSKWPMIELCWFMHATPDVKILPIFFLLSPSDLKEENNKRKWLTQWESFATLDPRIVVSDWEKAVKSLCSINGIIYQGGAREGEKSFIEKIVQNVYSLVVPQSTYDTSYMKGADRLLQIILDAFGTMESSSGKHELRQHEPLIGGPSTSLVSPQNAMASVLGIYGLPGSGKSTLCRRLFDHLSPQFLGKCFYLNLPTNPTPSDLIDQIARTFGLTTPIAHIDEVMSRLKSRFLARKRLFLIVDNIGDKSYEEVQRILCSVIGPGSKVVVVARTQALLRLTLESPLVQLEGGLICRCESIPMPTINEEEATELLIMRATSQGSAHRHALMKQKDKVLTALRMCGFHDSEYTKRSTSKLLYLPLVVERMGVMLAIYENDVDGWACSQNVIWSTSKNERLKMYRYDAVYGLIRESFKASLSDQQQLLFLDVALFLQPLRVWDLDEACSMLGSMHGVDVARIKNLLKDLERLCFIKPQYGCRVHVHDVYVEFAKSIQEKKLPPNCSYLQNKDILWDGMTVVDIKLEEEENTQRPVRAITLEVKDGCERIDLKSFSSLKALFLRECGSLRTLRLEGLTSLAILHITGYKVVPNLVCSSASVQNVQRFILQSERGEYLANAVTNIQQEQGNFGLHALQSLGSSIVNMLCHLKMSSYVPHFVKQPGNWELAKHMKNLQVLHLKYTGVRNLEDMGSCSWPHLQELRVEEYSLEGIRLGTLPTLKTFVLYTLSEPYTLSRHSFGSRLPQMMAEGTDLLRGCTALQEVDLRSDLFRNVELMKPTWRGLLDLRLVGVRSSMEGLGDALASSTQCTLQHLEIVCCDKIERVNVCAGQLPSLRELFISECPGIVEVEFGLQALPCLAELTVTDVSEMCVLSGLEGLKQLEYLSLKCCSMLSGGTSLRGLVRLSKLDLWQRPLAWKLHRALDFKSAGLEELSHLEKLTIRAAADMSGRTGPISLASLTNLVALETDGTLLLEGLQSLRMLRWLTFEGEWGFGDCTRPPLHLDTLPAGEHLTQLRVERVRHLRSLDGIQCLSHLQQFKLRGCPLLEELPSLHALHDLIFLHIVDCVKLKAVRGCDELRKLEEACFRGCESMEQVPFKDIRALGSSHPRLTYLDFRGCVFARDTKRELLMEWPAVLRMPRPLSQALLGQLLWEREECQSEVRRVHYRTVCDEGSEDGWVKVKAMELEELEQTIVSWCFQMRVPLFSHVLDPFLTHELVWVLGELVLAGKKLPKELLVCLSKRKDFRWLICFHKLVDLHFNRAS